MDPLETTDASVMGQALMDYIKAGRLDDAETLMHRLYELYPKAREVLVFPVMIAIQRGRPNDAWQLVNGLPDDQSPELKALCLSVLGDPSWHSYALAHEDSPDPFVRKAMRELLRRPQEADADELQP